MIPLIVANWKMQLSDVDALETATRLVGTMPSSGAEVVLCPPFTSLARIAEAIRDSGGIFLGAQDCAWEERGALTGEVSPADLIHLGCRYVILGHSERRQCLNESDVVIAQKVRAALNAGLRPILCVGETLDERNGGQRTAVLTRQLRVLDGLELIGTQRLCVAYEPVWAIGTGHAAAPEDAAECHAFIAEQIRESVGASAEGRSRLLYGGSVSPENIASFLTQSNVEGILVGTAGQTAARLRNLIAAIGAGV